VTACWLFFLDGILPFITNFIVVECLPKTSSFGGGIGTPNHVWNRLAILLLFLPSIPISLNPFESLLDEDGDCGGKLAALLDGELLDFFD